VKTQIRLNGALVDKDFLRSLINDFAIGDWKIAHDELPGAMNHEHCLICQGVIESSNGDDQEANYRVRRSSRGDQNLNSSNNKTG